MGDHSCNVRDRACIKKWLFCLFTVLDRVFLSLFSFCNFFHGMQRNNVNLQLLYWRYWQLFKYMYHINAYFIKIVSLSSLNYKKFNNSYNPLTGWVSLAWFVISSTKHLSWYIILSILARETRWTKAVKLIPSPFNTKQQLLFSKFSFKQKYDTHSYLLH